MTILYIIMLVLIIVLLVHITNQKLEITQYRIRSSHLPKEFDGFKIALLTDLHSNSLGKDNMWLIDAIHDQKPDIILVAGDMIIGEKEFEPKTALDLMRQLVQKYPVYYAPGNHELKISLFEETRNTTYPEYVTMLKSMGVQYLDNQQVFLRQGEQGIWISGLSIGMEYYGKVWNQKKMMDGYLKELLGRKEKDNYHILLAHNPQYLKQYSAWGADLVLSGHVHGGIIRIPGLGGVIAPNYRLFPKYDGGKYTLKDTVMILSRGLGSHTIKLRIGNNPELVIVEVNCCKK